MTLRVSALIRNSEISERHPRLTFCADLGSQKRNPGTHLREESNIGSFIPGCTPLYPDAFGPLRSLTLPAQFRRLLASNNVESPGVGIVYC